MAHLLVDWFKFYMTVWLWVYFGRCIGIETLLFGERTEENYWKLSKVSVFMYLHHFMKYAANNAQKDFEKYLQSPSEILEMIGLKYLKNRD